MNGKKVFISFIVILLCICNFIITYANVTPNSYMKYVRAEKAILLSEILIVVQIIIFIILTFLLKKSQINRKTFLVFSTFIFICFAVLVGAYFIYKDIYNKNYEAYQNYLNIKNGNYTIITDKKKDDYNNKINEIIDDDVEIEKKYLIDKDKIPFNLTNTNIYEIEQTYISFSPEIRVRKINDGESYSFAVKTHMTDDGLIRNEMEENITEKEYNTLVKKKEANTIYKTRYQFLHEENIYAIDIFSGELSGLAYLEIEFTSKEEANNFKTPEWVLEDVTKDIRYKNSYIARYGIPKR